MKNTFSFVTILAVAASMSLAACSEKEEPAAPPAAEVKPPEPPKPVEPPPPAPAATGANTGVPECDEYIVAYEACIDKMGAMARSAAESALKAQRDGFEKAAATPEAKKALGPQCKQLKESIKASCP